MLAGDGAWVVEDSVEGGGDVGVFFGRLCRG